jgi:hypothetical protein
MTTIAAMCGTEMQVLFLENMRSKVHSTQLHAQAVSFPSRLSNGINGFPSSTTNRTKPTLHRVEVPGIEPRRPTQYSNQTKEEEKNN